MVSPLDCDKVRLQLPELALGVAGGEERARALDHVATCPDCRQRLNALSEVADELLLLAPLREPPPGFESRVLERLQPAPVRPRRRRLHATLAVAGAALAAAAVAVFMTTLSSRDDRRLASHYREALARANGKSFDAARLYGPDGSGVGQAFGYQGSPSWVFVIVRKSLDSGVYRTELVTRRHQRVRLRTVRLKGAPASWGQAIPIDFGQVAALRLTGRTGKETLEAEFPGR